MLNHCWKIRIIFKVSIQKKGGFLPDVGYLSSHWFDYSTEEWLVVDFDKSFWTVCLWPNYKTQEWVDINFDKSFWTVTLQVTVTVVTVTVVTVVVSVSVSGAYF
jgi:hypothetical protein